MVYLYYKEHTLKIRAPTAVNLPPSTKSGVQGHQQLPTFEALELVFSRRAQPHHPYPHHPLPPTDPWVYRYELGIPR